MTGDNALRRADGIGGQELSYAEVKAIASSNPAVLTLAEVEAELQRLTLLKKNHLDKQYVARRSVRDLPGTIASINERLIKLSADQETATKHTQDAVTINIGKRPCSREDPTAVLADQFDYLPRNVRQVTSVPLAIYHLPGPALRPGVASAIPGKGVPRRGHHNRPFESAHQTGKNGHVEPNRHELAHPCHSGSINHTQEHQPVQIWINATLLGNRQVGDWLGETTLRLEYRGLA